MSGEARILLRGCFSDGGTPENTTPNIMRLVEAVEADRYRFAHPGDAALFKWVSEFFRDNGGPPTLKNLEHANEKLANQHDLDWDFALEFFRKMPLTTYSEYAGLLKTELEAYRRQKAKKIVHEGDEIIGGYLRPKEKGPRLEGLEDAFSHIVAGLGPLLEAPGKPARSDVWAEGQAVLDEYEAAKRRKPGLRCGLGPIDACFGGTRSGELWTHAAFTGNLKTTLALNFAYDATIETGANVLYVSLEMPAEQLRRLSYALHSSNERFEGRGLDYGAIKEGRLTPADEVRLREIAADVAKTAKGKLIVWSPPLTPTIAQVQTHAELIDRQHPIGLVVIDHSGLVKPSARDRDFYVRMNSVFTDGKRLAMGFGRGRGVPVLMLHQLNREGFREASKGKSISLVHLSNTNEAERSSDYITYSWVDDELRGRNRARVGCLKNREGGLFAAFEADVNFPSRRVSYQAHQEDGFSLDDDLEVLASLNAV